MTGVFIFVIAALLPSLAHAQLLPAGWAAADVGAPVIPGVATHAAGVYTVSGSGSGVAGTGDQFTFVYQRITGDATVFARVNALPLLGNAQAGVMIRQGLGAGAAHGSVLVSRDGGIRFVRRRTGSAATAATSAGSGSAPVWLRLDRRGSTMTASWSATGTTWTPIGSDTVPATDVLYVGLAAASGTIVAPAQILFSGVQTASLLDYGGPLPGGWTSQDIGGPGRAGAAAYDAGTFGIRAGGADIAATWDQFHYAYVVGDGNVDIVARVRDLGDTNAQAKAGVMIRDSLTANGAHASMLVTSTGASLFRRRTGGGGASTDTPGPTNSRPVWVKLSLRDGVVTASWSENATSWTVVGTEPMTLPSPFYVGLAVTSRNNSATVTANLDAVSVHVAPPQNSEPSVSLTEPASGATFDAPADVVLGADASDADGTIARVDFYQGGTLIATDTTAPYRVTWNGVAAGTYSLTAVATDDDGATQTSAARTITVTAPNQPPAASLTAPANGATYTAPAAITVSANASDSDGSVVRVDFFHGSTLIGSDTTSPYSVTWNNVQAGTYSLTAVATDDDGSPTASAARSVTVNAPANQPPAVSLTAPANGATFTAPANVTVSANASDADGTVTRVDFYQGSTLLGSDTSSPYSFAWNDVADGSYSITARATDSAGATTTSAAVAVTVSAPGAPAGWTAADVGSPTPAGSTTYSGSTFTVRAGGSDIWNAADQFHFVYQAVTGDVDLVARVATIGNTHPYAKSGIMIRASLAGNAAHASMLLTAANGLEFVRRATTGATSINGAGAQTGAPIWVKLTRRGNTITGFDSTNGTTWTERGTQTLALPATFYIGLAVTSHNTTTAMTSTLDNVAVAAAAPNGPPAVSLTAPASGATFTAPAAITVSASASDGDGTVARVDFYQGTTLIGSDTTSPYSIAWNNVPAGTYSLTARAVDDAGAETTSGARSVTVIAGANQPPTVSLTAPADGATYAAPASITISASANDADGTVARVDFFHGTTLIASDTSSPFSVTWNNAPAGSYSLTARAVDEDGATATSAARSITVSAAANQPPTVSLTAPANGATYTAPASITISANASDSDGTIARVDFYQGTTLIGSDTSSPFSITWTNVTAGSYSLTVRAVDDDGATTTSAARSVTVNGTQPGARSAVFSASPDHDSLVNSYMLEIFAAGANPHTATPLVSQNLGKPAVVNGEVAADITATVNALSPGSYQATVSAVGSGGSMRSSPAPFTR